MTETETKENIKELFQNYFCHTLTAEIFQP